MAYNPLLNDGCNVFWSPYRKKLPLLDGGIIEYDVLEYRYDNYSNNQSSFYYFKSKRHFYNPCTLSDNGPAWDKNEKNPSHNYRFYCSEVGKFPKSASYIHHGSGNLTCSNGYWILTDNNGDIIPINPESIEGTEIFWGARENWIQHYSECEYNPAKQEAGNYAVPFYPCGGTGGVCTPEMKLTGSRIYPAGYSGCGEPTETDIHKGACVGDTLERNLWIPNPNKLFDSGIGAIAGKSGIGAGAAINVGAGVLYGSHIWFESHPSRDYCLEVWTRKIDVRFGVGLGAKVSGSGATIGLGPSISIDFTNEKVTDLCSDEGCPPPNIGGIECGRPQEPRGCCADNLQECNVAGFVCCYDPQTCKLVNRCRV